MSKTTADLREVLFSTIESVRKGEIGVAEAKVVADLSKSIVDTGRLDLDHSKHLAEVEKVCVESVPITSSEKQPVIESESKPVNDPDEGIVMQYYDDGAKPKDIANLVGSDIKTVTQIINRLK